MQDSCDMADKMDQVLCNGLVTDFDARRREAQALSDAQRAHLREQAKAALAAGLFTVTDKPNPPPGGTKHDYWSMGPYWWPNPDTADGLPYVRKDGYVNPETEDGRLDRIRLRNMCTAIDQLTQSWLAVSDPALAERVAELLRTFFLDMSTRMNPSLTYGQAIPGVCDGRGIGLIETTCFVKMLDNVLLLETKGGLSQDVGHGLRKWFNDFLDWMLTSEHGHDERHAINNHGSWMDAQLVAFALFTGRNKEAKDVLVDVPRLRIDTQLEPDGRQPHELSRTRSLDYSIYNLSALITLAQLGEHVNVNLWQYRSKDGRSINGAIDFLRPFADPKKTWPYPQIDPKLGHANPGLGKEIHDRLNHLLSKQPAREM